MAHPGSSIPEPTSARRRSITSSPSFQGRALEAEQWRISLLAASLALILVMWITRRLLGGVVASDNAAFYPILIIIVAALILSVLAIKEMGWRTRQGYALPGWRLLVGAFFDLAVPFGILFILHYRSPRGAYSALSGPTLFLVPIAIMLSVLRLRPLYSLCIGIAAAFAHWGLVWMTLREGGVDAHLIPVLSSYGALLAFTGIAAAILSLQVRRYIQEAVLEAESAERAAGKLSEIEHELDIAREIQQSLLPAEPPALAGFDIAGMARPATQAGGDYYDWQPLPDGRLVVAVADVTGHGIGPALVMAVCRAYSKATAPTAQNAAQFLERMNNLIVPDVSEGRFITMAVALLNSDGSVELLSAGHGPTFHYHVAQKRVEEFNGNGMPLGVSDGEQYDPTSYLKLAPGDALVLLTDGFMERMDPDGELFGTDRLGEAIVRYGYRPAAEMIAAIDADTTAFARGAPQTDDMTVVVMRRT